VLFALAFHAAARDPLIECGVDDGLKNLDGFVLVLSPEGLEAIEDVSIPGSASFSTSFTLLTLTITIAITFPPFVSH
jgi:hypothetical protein